MNFWFRDMKTYLIWKRDSNAEGRQSSIHIRQVDPDGISFKDDWKEVTLVTANWTTERRVIEGPWMIYRYLIYTESSNTTLNIMVVYLEIPEFLSIISTESHITTCFMLEME